MPACRLVRWIVTCTWCACSKGLHRALGRRDVHARPSHRWADPRALLLDGDRWAAVGEDVLAGLSLTDPAPAQLARQLVTLDAAWKQTAARLGEAGEDARARVVAGPNGRARLVVDHLDALGEPDSLVWLRAGAEAMLPRVDLPELLLEVHAWTGFLAPAPTSPMSRRAPRTSR